MFNRIKSLGGGTPQQQGVLLLLGAALLLLLLVIFLTVSATNRGVSTSNFPTPTQMQRDGTSRTQKIAPTQKSIVERTTKGEVEKLPTVVNTTIQTDGSTKYTLESPYITRKNEIIVKNNEVVFERILIPEDRDDPGYITISEYTSEYGQPQETIRGSHFYGNLIETFIYADKGFALIGNSFTDEVFEVHTFIPTTVENYKKQFGTDINEDAEAGHR